MSDILKRLHDLHRQATVERSHNYVGSVCIDAIEEITKLRSYVKRKRAIDAFVDCGFSEADAKKFLDDELRNLATKGRA
jgi:predicted transcriptional regulator